MLEGRDFEEKFDEAVDAIERNKKRAVELLTQAVKLLEQAENLMIQAAQKVDENKPDFDRIIRIEMAVEDNGIDLTNAIERMI